VTTSAYIAAAFAVLVGLAVWLARRGGRADAIKDQAQAGLDHAKRANAIDEGVRGLPDDELYRELRGDK